MLEFFPNMPKLSQLKTKTKNSNIFVIIQSVDTNDTKNFKN